MSHPLNHDNQKTLSEKNKGEIPKIKWERAFPNP